MGIIDADTHIDETDDTWEYMTGDDLRFKPTTQYPANPDPTKVPTRYWLIDGRRQLRFIRGDEESGTVVESRELLDVQVRLKHMDQLGTDIQVIYPTVFLMEATEKPEVASALRAQLQPMARRSLFEDRQAGCVGCACRRCTIWMRPSKSCASPRSMAPAAS